MFEKPLPPKSLQYYFPLSVKQACEFVFKLSWVCLFKQQLALIYLFVPVRKHPE